MTTSYSKEVHTQPIEEPSPILNSEETELEVIDGKTIWQPIKDLENKLEGSISEFDIDEARACLGEVDQLSRRHTQGTFKMRKMRFSVLKKRLRKNSPI
ncbi:hypothetical protein HYFRA_00004572 [Hymenoscyphus fraxineus]|uniref:Uncharacterized protein n=1 Tax=Hymenoscyphus fraxineus TaxID=746836 RepID=A0A9N9PPI2_9HELO|nr:hypothetical protein HYFRA_00004572 [Hymenoscyphus fraxineus]